MRILELLLPLVAIGCSAKAIDEGSCNADELGDLQEMCLSYGGNFSASSSASGADACSGSGSPVGGSGACELKGSGSCSILCEFSEEPGETAEPTDTQAPEDSGQPGDDTGSPGDDTGAPGDDTDSGSEGDSGGDTAPPTLSIPEVLVPDGTFEMGCTPTFEATGMCSATSAAWHLHTVTLTRSFWMTEGEISQAEFEAVLGYSPASFSACGGDCPVETVTWHEAAAFANAWSVANSLPTCYACLGSGAATECIEPSDPYACEGYRLPTEAEWEHAARCGEETLYAGSDAPDEVAWTPSNSGGTPHPGKTLAANACGIYDLSGNVAEWMQEGYEDYSGDSVTDPVGPTGHEERVFRGGSWIAGAYLISRYLGASPSSYIGFRVVRTD